MFQKSNTVKQTNISDLWLTVTVHDQHKAKTVKSHILPRYYRRRCSHLHGNPRGITVNVVPITAFSRGYRGIAAVPIAVQTSSLQSGVVYAMRPSRWGLPEFLVGKFVFQ